ncbi:MAG: hypothetical protein NTV02_02075 [Candidatus Zambryskibacteria bacterium]|nr:hypothetical protein [Candidatus Zambryskibacteria bacterium]
MQSKKIIFLTMTVGGYVGSYIPALWGTGEFSFASIIFSAIGGFAGIWLGYKISQ